MKNSSRNKMLPVDSLKYLLIIYSIIRNPNNRATPPPIAIVHGTTFKGKNCKRTTNAIAKIVEM